MRKAITTLQSAVRLRGSPVRFDAIFDVAGAVPESAAAGLLSAARSGSFGRVQAAVSDLIAAGYPAQEILLQLQVRGRLQAKDLLDTANARVDGW